MAAREHEELPVIAGGEELLIGSVHQPESGLNAGDSFFVVHLDGELPGPLATGMERTEI